MAAPHELGDIRVAFFDYGSTLIHTTDPGEPDRPRATLSWAIVVGAFRFGFRLLLGIVGAA